MKRKIWIITYRTKDGNINMIRLGKDAYPTEKDVVKRAYYYDIDTSDIVCIGDEYVPPLSGVHLDKLDFIMRALNGVVNLMEGDVELQALLSDEITLDCVHSKVQFLEGLLEK